MTARKRTSHDLDYYCDLFDLPKIDDISDVAEPFAYSATYEELLRQGEDEATAEAEALEAERYEQEHRYRNIKNALESAIERAFEPFDLDLKEVRPGQYVIAPNTSWRQTANNIRIHAINGVGMFRYDSNDEFYRANSSNSWKQLVLSNLHWCKRYADVYGTPSARAEFERLMR